MAVRARIAQTAQHLESMRGKGGRIPMRVGILIFDEVELLGTEAA
jgi:hypothetical protein